MKKVTEQILCDDCGKDLSGQKEGRAFLHFVLDEEELVGIAPLENNTIDLCYKCIIDRITYSHIFCPIGTRKCDNCKGKGKVKEFYGHNEYDWVECVPCSGAGYLPLKVHSSNSTSKPDATQ